MWSGRENRYTSLLCMLCTAFNPQSIFALVCFLLFTMLFAVTYHGILCIVVSSDCRTVCDCLLVSVDCPPGCSISQVADELKPRPSQAASAEHRQCNVLVCGDVTSLLTPLVEGRLVARQVLQAQVLTPVMSRLTVATSTLMPASKQHMCG